MQGKGYVRRNEEARKRKIIREYGGIKLTKDRAEKESGQTHLTSIQNVEALEGQQTMLGGSWSQEKLQKWSKCSETLPASAFQSNFQKPLLHQAKAESAKTNKQNLSS